jgi:hypothetical protein
MVETYSHTRIEAKADAVNLLRHDGHKTPPPARDSRPRAEVESPADLMQPAIQAEIARQVALAWRERQQDTPAAKGGRVIRFPCSG